MAADVPTSEGTPAEYCTELMRDRHQVLPGTSVGDRADRRSVESESDIHADDWSNVDVEVEEHRLAPRKKFRRLGFENIPTKQQ